MKLTREGTAFIISDFEKIKKYEYKKFEREDGENNRTYQVGDKKVPSVTTILSKTASDDKKKSLDAWRERIGYQEAQKITLEAALRGTEMHYVIECYLGGIGYLNLSPEGSKARIMAHKIIENLEPLKIIYGSEISLEYETQWAGSTDLVGLYKDKPTIIDFKQTNKPKREEFIEDYFYQIAAYSLAHKKNYGPIEQGMIAMCSKDGVYQQFMMDKNKLEEYEGKWFDRVKKFYTIT